MDDALDFRRVKASQMNIQQMPQISQLDAASLAQAGSQITVSNVSRTYGAGDFAKQVVQDCSFTVDSGKLTVMIGPSGCGKSTLIRLLAGFERPSSGTIAVDGKPVTGPGLDRLVVFQESALFPWMSTYDNIMFGPRARGEDTPEMRAFAEVLLRKVGLDGFRKKYPSQLSGGMQRRAELARSMINKPDIMMLDEPFRGLDAMTKRLMQEYYANLYEDFRRTTFFVTTDIDEAIYLADRILIMTNIPTQVRAVIDVDLPRPRHVVDITESDEANAIKMKALGLLHEEAMKSFARGSKAAADFVDAYSKRMVKD
jgi:NitT/TauT family transport system ATP-binding protein